MRLRFPNQLMCTALVLLYCWITLVNSAAAASKKRPLAPPPGPEPTCKFEVTSDDWHKNHDDAWNDALKVAQSEIEKVWRSWRPEFAWTPSIAYVERRFVRESRQEPKDFPNEVGPMVRVNLRVEINRADYRDMVKSARRAAAEKRLTLSAFLLAGCVAFLTFFSGYLHLNDWTKGYYTRWLRLGAGVAIALAGVILALFLAG